MANNIEITTNDGREVQLTTEESAFLRALRRLEKMPMGRLQLFGSGKLDCRLNDQDEFDGFNGCVIEHFSISCEGGDGGD
ncbi:hypothetical protein [Chryseobacterium sp. WLY505]|uniref:hypothetical protein n=1 Tax=Chryseobacterium sp. WLY505 TaxID=3068892 RepID=UPI0027968B1F|nr:hypothetical protein [Chryseobacterium sp. WLY505]MDQ1859283.1 hypothetical protein [Chryseobacterium sp. WLY505]